MSISTALSLTVSTHCNNPTCFINVRMEFGVYLYLRHAQQFLSTSCYSTSSSPGFSSLPFKLIIEKNNSWLPQRLQVDCWKSSLYKSKNRKRNRVETARFLEERMVDMSAEILSEAEIKASNAVEIETNMLSAVKSTKDAASAGTIVILGVLSCRSDILQEKRTHFSYYSFDFNLFLRYYRRFFATCINSTNGTKF